MDKYMQAIIAAAMDVVAADETDASSDVLWNAIGELSKRLEAYYASRPTIIYQPTMADLKKRSKKKKGGK